MKPMTKMTKPSTTSLFLSAAFVPALLLSGCSGGFSVPDTNVVQQSPVGSMKGSAYGGHAPIVGAHVYVLEPQSTGYGSQAKSLISSTASGATVNVSDPGLPTTAYYVTTDSTGQFNLTGDYTCDAGYPVYLYAYSGTPETTSGYPVYNISSVAVSGSGSSWTYTFTTTTNSFAYNGETVRANSTFGSFPSGNTAYVVSYPSPTYNTFTIGYSSGTAGTTNYSSPYPTVDFEPAPNPAIVELAVLGICPSSGSIATGGPIFNGTTSAPINYIYMNEVSTVAAAYAFAPFSNNGYSPTTGSNYASYIGTGINNLVGLQNAALNAGLLYSVNGSGPLSTTFAGEGHIANATTPGHGIINNVVIDTLANILAACVDSQNSTTTVGSSTTSAQCSQLFQYATNTGIPTTDPSPGTQPNDTATAAINIALHPQGPPSTDTTTTPSAWVAALYSLPTGVVPFAPNLTDQPNDFTIGVLYTAANTNNGNILYLTGASYVAVDKIGEVWIGPDISGSSGSNSGYITPLSPQGNVIFSEAAYLPNGYVPGPPVIDALGNLWIQPQNATSAPYFIRATSTSGNPYVYNNALVLANMDPAQPSGFYTGTSSYFGDKDGNMYFVNPSAASSSTAHYNLSEFPKITSSTYVPTDAGEVAIATITNTNNPSAAVLDQGGYLWVTQNAGSTGTSTVERTYGQVPNGVSTTAWSKAGSFNCAGIEAPTSLALTRSTNAVMADSAQFGVTFVKSDGTCTFIQNSSGSSVNRQGPGSYYPVAEATDGNDYVYSLNQEATNENLTSHQGSITVFNLQQETAAGVYALNFAWSPVYYPSGSSTLTSLLSYPQSLALDPSGNIWVVNSTTSGSNPNSVVEIIGAAGPTSTPISLATCATPGGCLSYRP